MKFKMGIMEKLVIIPAVISSALIVIGVLLGDIPILGNLIIISASIFIIPYFIYRYTKMLWLKGLEEQFPNFLRDLADSARSGMSIPESIGISSKANYGKLSLEIQKMHNRLSWGTPFLRVLEIFHTNVKKSKIISDSVTIIKQSYETGGSIPDTLDAVSKDIMMLKEAEAERSSMVKQQVMIMYGLFYIFLGISVMIIAVMVPMLGSQMNTSSGFASSGFSFSNPCEMGGIFPCGIFSLVCSMLAIKSGMSCYYVAVFFFVVVIQGLFSGLISGQLSDNSATSGFKHSLIMVFSSLGVFIFLSKIGFFPA